MENADECTARVTVNLKLSQHARTRSYVDVIFRFAGRQDLLLPLSRNLAQRSYDTRPTSQVPRENARCLTDRGQECTTDRDISSYIPVTVSR